MNDHSACCNLKAGHLFRGRFKLIHDLDVRKESTAVCQDMKQVGKHIYMKIEDSETWNPTIF